jgi:carbonic anhydrase
MKPTNQTKIIFKQKRLGNFFKNQRQSRNFIFFNFFFKTKTMDICCLRTKPRNLTEETDEKKNNNNLTFQSPIALSTAKSTKSFLTPSLNECPEEKVANYKFDKEDFDYHVADNIFLTNNELKYKMVQFHFHQAAEHVINNQEYDIELHLVFETLFNKKCAKTLVKKSRMIQKKESTSETKQQQTEVETTPENNSEFLPIFVIGVLAKVGKTTSKIFKKIIEKKEFTIPCPSMLPHFSYAGSLTTGDTAQNVSWNVLRDIETISEKDLIRLQKKSKGRRPIQPRAGRDIICAF